jgi:hypothetical protein
MKMSDAIEAASGRRYRVQVDGESAYCVVCDEDKELFLSGLSIGSQEELIARLVSKCWQGFGLPEALDQLKRSSVIVNDLPGVLHSVLSNYRQSE